MRMQQHAQFGMIQNKTSSDIAQMTMTPNDHEKREWRRTATDAYAKNLNDIGHRFSSFGALRNGESMPLATFDALQAEYLAWLIGGFQPKLIELPQGDSQ